MSELEKRLSALYLVCDECIADDIKRHLMAEIDRMKQALECYREALQGMCEDWFDMPPETQAKYIGKPKSHIAREALERGDAILKGEDAEKEDGK